MPHAPRRARRPIVSAFRTYLTDILKTPRLSAPQEAELARRIGAGDPEARDHMVRANLRLVVTIAKGYAGHGLPLEDLVAEGNLGLIRAAEGFDPEVGVRFSTYACHWVRQSIRKAIARGGKAVRVPPYMTALLIRWRRATAALRIELGRAPSEEEVASRLGLSARRLRVLRKAIRVGGRATEEGGPELNKLPSSAEGPGAGIEGAEEAARVFLTLDRMEPRRAAVLRFRFGLGGEPPQTLQEVGDRLGLTRERVRQIEREALALLRERLGY